MSLAWKRQIRKVGSVSTSEQGVDSSRKYWQSNLKESSSTTQNDGTRKKDTEQSPETEMSSDATEFEKWWA